MLWFIKIFPVIRISEQTKSFRFRFPPRHSSSTQEEEEVKIHSDTWPKVFRSLRFIHALLNPTTTTFHSRLYLYWKFTECGLHLPPSNQAGAGKFNFDVKVELSRFDGGTFVSVYLRSLLSIFPLLHYLTFLNSYRKKLFPFILIHELNKYIIRRFEPFRFVV